MEYHNKFTLEQTRWLEALESGEWQQAIGHLRVRKDGKDGYCCLGVATYLLSPDHPALELRDSSDQDINTSLGQEAPDSVVDTLMLHSSVGANFDGSEDLAQFNDSLGYTFEDIAKFIREYPWEVFLNFDETYQKKDNDNV
jgi:hypothetical protein